MKNDEVLTTDEAIRYLEISRLTFLIYIPIGRIRTTIAGHGWRVLESEIHRFLRGGKGI
jgi:excisionase family DNA binding protein